MMLLQVESWHDGALIATHTLPNPNAARVYRAHQEARGLRTLLIHPRAEIERAR